MNSTGVEITAGLGGFLVVFFLAIALVLLGTDLNRRLRRLKHQEELRLEEERRAREAGGRDPGTDGGPGGDGRPGDEGDDEDEGSVEPRP
ncbi:hypothetical protein [Ornithinimicrobium cavernae]|uniref:hypothetical protein n=1 Tax=Ornithinimicrobium cavernae TaxID=2666047 RepID=UPI000D6953CC|nr:hypothetical protein [Ornithinimicrobium cavernae]